MADEARYALIFDREARWTSVDIEMDYAINRQHDSSLEPGSVMPRARLFEIHHDRLLLTIFPVLTRPTRRFLQQKYKAIRSISVELPSGYELPLTQDEAQPFLKRYLPAGFIQDPVYGLGVVQEMRPLIKAVETLPNIFRLAIRERGVSEIDGTTFHLARGDYEDIRLAFQRVARNYQGESRKDREILAHNFIPHRHRPEAFPEQSRPFKPGTVYKLLGGKGLKATQMRGRDRKGLVDVVTAHAEAIAERDPEMFVQLQRDIELVSLDRLIRAFSRQLESNQGEAAWQKLFAINPFILSMVFGYPVVLVRASAPVGGMGFDGKGVRIADFLMANAATHNAALVEIKTPQTPLFGQAYSRGLQVPSRIVTAAIVQVLDQRARLATDLPNLQSHSDDEHFKRMRSDHVDCVVVVGRTPKARAEISALELFRGQWKDVRLITFDELLEKLQLLRELLAGERYEAPADDDDLDGDPLAGLVDRETWGSDPDDRDIDEDDDEL